MDGYFLTGVGSLLLGDDVVYNTNGYRLHMDPDANDEDLPNDHKAHPDWWEGLEEYFE